jgi:hypothetical protein
MIFGRIEARRDNRAHYFKLSGNSISDFFNLEAGLPDCVLGTAYKNGEKRAKMAIKCTKWPQNIPKWPLNRPHGHKICQQRPLQDPRKFSQILIFGLKSGNLATLFLKVAAIKSFAFFKGHSLRWIQVPILQNSNLTILQIPICKIFSQIWVNFTT